MKDNLGEDTFPDPVSHFGAPWRPFWILQTVRRCRRWASAPFDARLELFRYFIYIINFTIYLDILYKILLDHLLRYFIYIINLTIYLDILYKLYNWLSIKIFFYILHTWLFIEIFHIYHTLKYSFRYLYILNI